MFLPFRSASFDDRISLMTSIETLEQGQLPLEWQFLFSQDPAWQTHLQGLLRQGYGVLIRTQRRFPAAVVQAIDGISRQTQAGTHHAWLTQAWLASELPLITEDELQRGLEQNVPLQAHVQSVIAQRGSLKRLMLIDIAHKGVVSEIAHLVQRMQEALKPLVHAYEVRAYLLTRSRHRQMMDRTIFLVTALLVALVFAGSLLSLGLAWMIALSGYDVWRYIQDRDRHEEHSTPSSYLRQYKIILISTLVRGILVVGALQVLRTGALFTTGLIYGLALSSYAICASVYQLIRSHQRYLQATVKGKLAQLSRAKRWTSVIIDAWYAIPRLSRGIVSVVYPLFVAGLWMLWPVLMGSPVGLVVVVLGFFLSISCLERWMMAYYPVYLEWRLGRQWHLGQMGRRLDNLSNNP